MTPPLMRASRRLRGQLAAWLAGAALVGCAAAPAPDLAAIRADAGAPPAIALAAEPPWWCAFEDPLLAQWMEEALRRNVDVALARSRVQQAQLEASVTDTNRRPDASLALNGGVLRRLDEPDTASTRSYTGTLAASRQLDLWGKLAATRDSATAKASASGFDREAVRLEITLAVAELYWRNGWLHQRSEGLARTDTDALRILALAEARQASGAASLDEVLQIRQEMITHAQERRTLEHELANVRSRLAELMGRPPAWRPAEEPRALPVAVPEVPAVTMAAALSRRPDVGAAEARLRAEWSDADAQRTSLYPAINLTAGIGTNGGRDLFRWLQDPVGSLAGSAMVALMRPQTFRTLSQLAAERQQQATLSFQKQLLHALRDVADALETNDRDVQQSVRLHDALRLARDATTLSEARLSLGQTGLLPVLRARDAQRQAELVLAEGDYRRLMSTARLMLALGGSVPARQDAAPSVRESGALAEPYRPGSP